ncbi:Maf family protein [soil metagenome]
MTVLLASGSPRRRELLGRLGIAFDVASPDVDETPRSGEHPATYVSRLALDKVAAVPAADDVLVIAADTTVEVDGAVFEKPVDADDARRMLGALSHRTHRVQTGVAVRLGERSAHDVVSTDVTFVALSSATIDWYVATGEPMDKAGAYALQGAGAVLVSAVHGSVSNVIGLPLAELLGLATRVGRPLIP